MTTLGPISKPEPLRTNDLKKGVRVQLRNGWYATIADNARGNTRMATVEGYETETGSVYAHDIVRAKLGAFWVELEHTEAQKACRKANLTLFGG